MACVFVACETFHYCLVGLLPVGFVVVLQGLRGWRLVAVSSSFCFV